MPGYGIINPYSIADAAAKLRAAVPATAPAPVPVSAPPINQAALRASNRNARMQVPGMAPSIADIPFEPTDQGMYVSPSQRAENRDVAARGAFQASPEWKGVGGGIRSAAQMYQDLQARDLIDAGNEQALAGIRREEEVRGDPLSLATNARKKQLAYEDVLPATASSRVRFGNGPSLRDYQQESPDLGTPTMGEYRANRSLIAQAQAKQNPKDVAEGATTLGRGRLAEELDILRQQLQDDVRTGKRNPADADAAWKSALDKANSLAEILKSGFPKSDSLLGQ